MILVSLKRVCSMDSNNHAVGFVCTAGLGMAVDVSMNKRTFIHIFATDVLIQRVYYCINWRGESL